MKSHVKPGSGGPASTSTDLGIAGFESAELIGQGGFGSVYRARQVALDRVVAIKILSIPALSDDTRMRFERECRAVGSLSAHPHIITVHDCGQNGWGRPYIVMDYMARGSLAGMLTSSGALAWPTALDLIIKICGAVETAHAAGILHRDIKPENVLLSAYGEPTLADFGISSLAMEHQTVSGAITASLAHAAPELLNGDPATKRSDLYAVASTLFTLIAGASPFARRGDEPLQAVITRILNEPVADLRPRGIPDDVCTVLEACLAKDPAARPASVDELGAVLRALQETHGATPSSMIVDPTLAAETADRFDLLSHFAPGDTSNTGRTRARFRPILEPPKEEEPGPRPLWKRPLVVGAAVIALTLIAATAVALTRNDRAPEQPLAREPVAERDDAGNEPVRERDERVREGKRPQRDRKRAGGRNGSGTVVAGGSGSYVPPAVSSDSGGSSGTSQGSSTGTSGSQDRKEQSREEPPPPRPAPPNVSLYHLYNTETGEHYMTISGAEVQRRPGSDGWRHTVVGRVYSSQVNGTRGIPLDDGYTAYVFSDSHPQTDPPTNTAPIYRGSEGSDYFYSRSATEAESYSAVGYVAI